MVDGVEVSRFPNQFGVSIDMLKAPSGNVIIGDDGDADSGGTLSAVFDNTGPTRLTITITDLLSPGLPAGTVIGSPSYPYQFDSIGHDDQTQRGFLGVGIYRMDEPGTHVNFSVYQQFDGAANHRPYKFAWRGTGKQDDVPQGGATKMSIKLANNWEHLGVPHGNRGAGLRLWDGTKWLYEVTGDGPMANVKPMKVWTGTQWELGCLFGTPTGGGTVG